MNTSALTFASLDCALAAGSTTTLTLGAAPYYSIDGKAYTQGSTSAVQPSLIDLNTSVNMAGIPPGYGTVIVVGATATESTTLRMVQGELNQLGPNASAFHPGDFMTAPEFPILPDNFCPFGYVIVKVATDYTVGAKYVFGSNNTTATGAQGAAATAHANTFTSVMALPSRPQYT